MTESCNDRLVSGLHVWGVQLASCSGYSCCVGCHIIDKYCTMQHAVYG